MNDSPRSPEPVPMKVGRGVFLGLAGVTGVGLVLGSRVNLSKYLPSLPGGQNVGGFTIYNIASGYPMFDPSTYRLRVDGLVEEPREYTYADLVRMSAVRETRYYQCVTGWVVPHPRWEGVRLWDIVQASKPTAAGTDLFFSCMDNAYTESLTFAQAKQRDVLLAYGLNGKALAREQGLPLRLVVPGMYGYKYAKWVNHVQVVNKVIPGYWEQNGYDINAYIGASNGL